MFRPVHKIRMTVGAVVACGIATAYSLAPCQAQENGVQASLIWKIEHVGSPPSYVMGTIHIPDTTVFRLRDTIRTLFDRSRIFFGELDLDSAKGAMLNVADMMLKGSTTLRSFYADSDWVRIDALMRDRLGPMAAMTSKMKPSTVLLMIMMQSIPSTAPITIDEFLWRRAGERRIPRFGIERAEEQLHVLDSMPSEALADLARDPDAFDSALTTLRDAYVAERLDLVAEASKDIDQYEEFATMINDDRNVTMATRLEKELRSGGVFVAVGAAHLPGPHGLLSALRARGFTVTALSGGQRSNWLR